MPRVLAAALAKRSGFMRLAPGALIILLGGIDAEFAHAQELDLYLSSRLRYERDAEGSDWDSSLFTSFTLSDVIKQKLDLKFSGWGLWDIDAGDAFDDAIDQKRIRISEAYADIHNLGPITRLRLGRQYALDLDSLHFDGALLRLREPRPISFILFGGRSVTYYESAEGDWVGGGAVLWRPSWRTRHQFDAYLIREGGELFTASAWRWNRYWGRRWRSDSRLRFIDDEIRDYRLHLSKYFASIGVGLDVDAYLQPKDRGGRAEARSRTLSQFSRILGTSRPQYRLSANASKYFGEDWSLQLGGTIRRRFDDDDRDTFNSLESNSAYLSLTRSDAFIDNLDLTLSLERIDNELDRLSGVTGEIAYRPHPNWEFSLGASLSRYNFEPIDFNTTLNGQDDVDLLLEDLDALTYFFDVRWKPSERYDLRAEVAFQDTDGDLENSGVSVRIGVTYRLKRSLAPASREP